MSRVELRDVKLRILCADKQHRLIAIAMQLVRMAFRWGLECSETVMR